jgi:peptidoglycan DL-endopeptidase LytE
MKHGIKFLFLSIFVLIFPALALAAKTHKVKKNDSLYTLAKKYHTTVNDIKSANSLTSRHIKSGDVLIIPARTRVAKNEEQSGKAKVKPRLTRPQRVTTFAV